MCLYPHNDTCCVVSALIDDLRLSPCSAKTMNAMFFSSTPVVPKSGALSLVPGEADLAPGYGGHKGRNLPESVLQTIKRERAVSTMAPSTSGQVASIKSSQAAHPKEIEQLLKKS